MLGAVVPRLRLALIIVVGGALAALMPSLSATMVEPPSAVVLAALVIALIAAVSLNGQGAISVARALAPPPRTADATPAYLAARVTDALHHPLRPRAPGSA